MKSAFLLSADAALIEKVRRAVHAAGPAGWHGCRPSFESDVMVQLTDLTTDDLFTLETYDPRPENSWAYQDPPHHPEPGVSMPDLSSVLAYGALCRSEVLFATLVRAITEASGEPAWVLDENDVVWDARAVDPDRVQL